MSSTTLSRGLLAAIALASLCAHAATTINVTTTAMTIAADGGCSLMEAFEVARTNASSNECAGGTGGPYTINLPANATFTATTPTVHEPTWGDALLPIVGGGATVIVNGNGSTLARDPGASEFRLGFVQGYSLTLRDLTLSNFSVAGATFAIGAIADVTNGTLQLERVTARSNAAGQVGLIHVSTNSQLNVLSSVFRSNAGTEASIRLAHGGSANIANSTFWDNSAGCDVGATESGALTMSHNTLTRCFSYQGTGAMTSRGNAYFGSCTGYAGAVASFNIGAGTCDGTISDDPSSFIGLAANGGPSETIGFATPSVALDADTTCTFASTGPNTLFSDGAPITHDQRGVPRDAGACDIGAYEDAKLQLSPSSLTAATQGSLYFAGVTVVSGGVAPFAFTALSGLPAGVGLVTVSGNVFNVVGTPSAGAGTTANILVHILGADAIASYRRLSLSILPGLPEAPSLVGTTSYGPTSLFYTAHFTAPAANGSAITSYRVKCAVPAGFESTTSTGSPIDFQALSGTSFSGCRVHATNGVGEGPGSAAFAFQILPTTASSPARAAASPTGAASVSWNVTFSRAVTGVDAGDFQLVGTEITGAAITGVTGAGTSYVVTASTGTGAPIGSIGLDLVDNDSIVDATGIGIGGPGAGNGGATGEVYAIDRTTAGNPTVASIALAGPASVAAGTTQSFTVTFTEPVTGVDMGDFALVATDTAAGTITGLSGSGSTYTVTVTITAAGGTLRLDLTDNDSIRDLADNALGGTGAGNGNFTGAAYTVLAATRTFTAPSATGTGDITASFTGGSAGCTFASPQFIPVTGHPRSPPQGLAMVEFPHGLFDFSIENCQPGDVVTVTVTYPTPVAAAQYWKYGPTPIDPTPHWYVLPSTNNGSSITFEIRDGELGDDDLLANGTIVDQGGPGVGGVGPVQTPTLSQWGMMLLTLTLLGFGMRRLRERA